MHSKLIRPFALAAISVSVATGAYSQRSGTSVQDFDLGKAEYRVHCTICHGFGGKGDGVYATQGTDIPDLTELSAKNKGVFPFARVYQTIDRREMITSRDTRDSHTWGRVYETIGSYELDPGPVLTEAFVRARILALTEYVYRLQAK